LAGVLLQTGAEEILFRGYIQQQLAARFRSPILWMILPSALFGVLHWQPDVMGDNAIYVVAAATLFGLLAADLTAKTGSLGAAWGFHFANNVVAILIVSLDGPLSGLALYTASVDPASPEIRPLILLDMGTTVVTWLIIRTIVSRVP
jgi:membrane protease YdiL (CAAX protease family)